MRPAKFLAFRDKKAIRLAAREAALAGGALEGHVAGEAFQAHEFGNAGGERRNGACGGRGSGSVCSVPGGWADNEREFAADSGAGGELCGEFGKRTAPEFFVDFGEFAGDGGRARTEDFRGVGKARDQAVWGFEQHDRARLGAEALESAAAFGSARGQKAGE